MDTPAPDTEAPVDPALGPEPDGLAGVIADVRQLASDARTLAEAELAYQTSRAKVAGEAARTIAVLGVGAFALAFFALGALAVGLLLALTPLVTAWGATAIVAGGLAVAAFACLAGVAARVKRLRAVLGGTTPEHRP